MIAVRPSLRDVHKRRAKSTVLTGQLEAPLLNNPPREFRVLNTRGFSDMKTVYSERKRKAFRCSTSSSAQKWWTEDTVEQRNAFRFSSE